ncbi:hypothetical protein ACFFGV_05750 [Pontibacillus salicampi]|uniref:Uncharacterized protein n=1 Tax=Pontibacillus salicampi TaxID=1449801 RepID=A0ABV6LLA1_9BACI
MQIITCKGYTLEKKQPNSPEDAFSLSELVYQDRQEEQKLEVTYITYFESTIAEEEKKKLYDMIEGTPFQLKDLIALFAFIQYPEYKHRKRVFINQEANFNKLFESLHWGNVSNMLGLLAKGRPVDVDTVLELKL